MQKHSRMDKNSIISPSPFHYSASPEGRPTENFSLLPSLGGAGGGLLQSAVSLAVELAVVGATDFIYLLVKQRNLIGF